MELEQHAWLMQYVVEIKERTTTNHLVNVRQDNPLSSSSLSWSMSLQSSISSVVEFSDGNSRAE